MPERLDRFAVSVLLLASAVIGIMGVVVMSFPGAEAQRTVPPPTVTVYVPTTIYVPTVQPVYMTVLQTVQVTVTTTQSLSYTSYSTSYSVTWYSTTYSVTQWSTSVTTALGILGALPSSIFGTYGDMGLIGTGAVLGAALTAMLRKRSMNLKGRTSRTGMLYEGDSLEGFHEKGPGESGKRYSPPRRGIQYDGDDLESYHEEGDETGRKREYTRRNIDYYEEEDGIESFDEEGVADGTTTERRKKGRSNTPNNDKD